MFGSKLKTVLARKARNMPVSDLFIGQAVYYWAPTTGIEEGKWNSPKLIGGLYDSQVLLISGPKKFLTVAWEWVKPVNATLKIVGSEGQLLSGALAILLQTPCSHTPW